MVLKVSDFKYLGSYIWSSEKYVNIRIAALNTMNSIWKSRLSDKMKRNDFSSTVDSVIK